ncbi:unnamed protein product [Leptosia nina]|uniref:Nose resistant-to-fluoxetine protein N-terminal domain-containing protein n=1 Tax=Leptosia nina TaxID=320188 RepID=A0AAV1JYI0_9NEOP
MAFLRAAHPWDGYDQKLYESVLDYRECEKQLKLLSNSTAVLPFIDATAKLPSGILSLNVNDYGDYYQCLQIDNQVEDMHLEGKYCFIVVPFSQNISVPGWMSMGGKMSKFTFSAVGRSLSESATASTDEFLKSYLAPRNVQKFTSNATISRAALRLGVCIPKVCNIDQVNDFITPPIPIPKVEYLSGPCRLPGDKMYTIADYVTFGIFGTILLLTILSTCYDLFQVFIRRKSKAPNRLFTMMSIYTNTKRLLKFLPPKYSMDCVDGIRAISMIWVMCGHAYVFELLSPAHNLLDMIEWTTHLTSTWINTAPMVVDTFFMLTGLFCVYTLPNRITAKRFLKSIHIFYLYRYFRTLPVLVVAILIQASIIHWIADGPDWDRISYAVVCCRNRWWATVLHVQNIIEPTAVCVFQSWYLTVDTQLYFLSPFIIVFLLMSKAIAWFVLGVSFVISIVTLAYYVYYYKYPSVLNGLWYSQQFFEYYVNFYANTATRASPFIVGLMVGYILWLNREKGLFLSKVCITLQQRAARETLMGECPSMPGCGRLS